MATSGLDAVGCVTTAGAPAGAAAAGAPAGAAAADCVAAGFPPGCASFLPNPAIPAAPAAAAPNAVFPGLL